MSDRIIPAYRTSSKRKSVIDTRSDMTNEDSWLNSYDNFVNDLELPAEQEVDAIPLQTVTRTRTSKSEDRAELSNQNELGAEAGGLYIYIDNLIATAFTEGSIFFYDNSGNVDSVIQQPTPGNLGISGDSIDIIATVDILLDAPLVSVSGTLSPESDNSSDLGDATHRWDTFYVISIQFAGANVTALSEGQMAYHDNAGTQQFRGNAGGFFGSFDLTAV
jgi:hypothetical protein